MMNEQLQPDDATEPQPIPLNDDEGAESKEIAHDAALEAEAPDAAPRTAEAQGDLTEMLGLLAAIRDRLANLEAAQEATAKQVSFLPPQLRLIGGKVDGLATAISEPRYRAVLLNLLGVYDLTDQALRAAPSDAGGEHRRNYEVLRAQLRQILEANGLAEITTNGAFDPALHRAVQRLDVADPAQDGQIIELARPGFRTEQAILRFAEVVVGHYAPPVNEDERPNNDQ